MATSFHSTQLKFQMTNESKKWWGKTRLDPVLVLIGEGPAMTLEVPSFTNEHLDKQQLLPPPLLEPPPTKQPRPVTGFPTSLG